MSASVTPWWDAMRLRREIVAGSGVIDDVQMSLFNAVYRAAGERPPYSDQRTTARSLIRAPTSLSSLPASRFGSAVARDTLLRLRSGGWTRQWVAASRTR